MQKVVISSLVAIFTLTAIPIATAQSEETVAPTGQILKPQPYFNVLRKGTRGQEVKELQEILKTDPSIYPEGLVTGYYGPLTTAAVKRLQKKFDIGQTGIVDEPTSKIIFPHPRNIRIRVTSPNGGETWNRAQIHNITWEVLRVLGEEGKEEPMSPSDIRAKYFWPKASIDLLRSSCKKTNGTLVCPEIMGPPIKHIAFLNLFDGSYAWRIGNDVPNGSGYIIRISIGRGVGCIWAKRDKLLRQTPEQICPPYYNIITGDTSDGPFTITGEIGPSPKALKKAVLLLEEINLKLQEVIALLKSLL